MTNKVSQHLKFTVDTKKITPKYKGNHMILVSYLSHFKPIVVDKEHLNTAGLLKQTIVVNPLTGIVEVTGWFFMDYLYPRPQKWKVRKWNYNEAFKSSLSISYDINKEDMPEHLTSFAAFTYIEKDGYIEENNNYGGYRDYSFVEASENNTSAYEFILPSVIDFSDVGIVVDKEISYDRGIYPKPVATWTEADIARADRSYRTATEHTLETLNDLNASNAPLANSRDAWVMPPEYRPCNTQTMEYKEPVPMLQRCDNHFVVIPGSSPSDHPKRDFISLVKYKISYYPKLTGYNDIIDYYEKIKNPDNWRRMVRQDDYESYLTTMSSGYSNVNGANTINLVCHDDITIKIGCKSLNVYYNSSRSGDYWDANFMLYGDSEYRDLYTHLNELRDKGELVAEALIKFTTSTSFPNHDIESINNNKISYDLKDKWWVTGYDWKPLQIADNGWYGPRGNSGNRHLFLMEGFGAMYDYHKEIKRRNRTTEPFYDLNNYCRFGHTEELYLIVSRKFREGTEPPGIEYALFDLKYKPDNPITYNEFDNGVLDSFGISNIERGSSDFLVQAFYNNEQWGTYWERFFWNIFLCMCGEGKVVILYQSGTNDNSFGPDAKKYDPIVIDYGRFPYSASDNDEYQRWFNEYSPPDTYYIPSLDGGYDEYELDVSAIAETWTNSPGIYDEANRRFKEYVKEFYQERYREFDVGYIDDVVDMKNIGLYELNGAKRFPFVWKPDFTGDRGLHNLFFSSDYGIKDKIPDPDMDYTAVHITFHYKGQSNQFSFLTRFSTLIYPNRTFSI